MTFKAEEQSVLKPCGETGIICVVFPICIFLCRHLSQLPIPLVLDPARLPPLRLHHLVARVIQ